MKKYLLTLLTLFAILAPNVKAETINLNYNYDLFYLKFENYDVFKDFLNLKHNREIYKNLYNDLLEYYNSNYKQTYPYFICQLDYSLDSENGAIYTLTFDLFSTPIHVEIYTGVNDGQLKASDSENAFLFSTYKEKDTTYISPQFSNTGNSPVHYGFQGVYGSTGSFYENFMISSNFDLVFQLKDNSTVTINNFRDKGTITFENNDTFPFLYSSENIFDNLATSNLTTVNLDKYEYVILNLKDYNQKNAFNTNLKVKGSIGITPIYNFGQTAKDDIMGSKVQDRCNVKYNDYTDYRLSILKQDLQNNSFYVVKGCEVGSSFKFDNTIFDVTYVDENNKSDPIVSIGGKYYHVIPFEKLPSSANKNEEENYVPGESEKFTLSSIIKNLASTLEGIWNSFTSFFSFVTKMFSVLPSEFQAIAILTFSTGCILGLIKILKS